MKPEPGKCYYVESGVTKALYKSRCIQILPNQDKSIMHIPAANKDVVVCDDYVIAPYTPTFLESLFLL